MHHPKGCLNIRNRNVHDTNLFQGENSTIAPVPNRIEIPNEHREHIDTDIIN